MLKLLAFVLPLGLDSFAIAAALGTAALPAWQRWRISVIFVIFEAGMPLIGLAAGAPLAHAIGGIADYLAAAALLSVGAWMLLADDDSEAGKAKDLLSKRGIAVISLGLAISTDELAIGFSLGLTRLPAATVIAAIAVQALLASQIGLAIGGRIGERWRERAERLAGAALAALGAFLIISKLLHLSSPPPSWPPSATSWPTSSSPTATDRRPQAAGRRCYYLMTWVFSRVSARSAGPMATVGTSRSAAITVVGAGVSAGAVRAGTAVSRPAAAAATRTMTTPRPVKNPICSAVRISVVKLAGTPAGAGVVHSGASTGPSANQAPLTMPTKAPNSAVYLLLAMTSRMPPSSAAPPGRISSQSRPVL